MKNMEIQHLRYFAAVAKYQHMTKAAEELHIAQSALSRVVKGLEDELGVDLFDRVGRSLILNDNGRILLKYSEKIFSSLQDLRREIKDNNLSQQDETITMVIKVASKFLPKIIAGFKAKYPQSRFVILQNEVPGQIHQVWDIKLDAGVKLQEDEFSTCVLKEEICLAMPRNHPLAKRNSIALEEVSQESFLGMQTGSSMNEIAVEYCRRAGFQPHIVLASDNPATLRGMMRLGMGIAFNPVITWKEVSEEEFCLVPIKGRSCYRFIHLRLRPDRYHSRLVLAFKEYLIAFFKELQ